MSRYSDYVMALSPKLYWRLGDAAGFAQDASGNAHHATVAANIHYGETSSLVGDADTCMYFGGDSQQSVADHADYDPDYNVDFSIIFRCKFTAATDSMVLVSKWVAAAYPFQIITADTGKIAFYRYDATHNPVAKTAAVVNDGAWHQITCRKSGTKMQILDGATLGPEVTDTTDTTTTNAAYFNVGLLAGGSDYFTGYLDEIAYIPSAISWAQAQTLYQIGAGRQGGYYKNLYGI